MVTRQRRRAAAVLAAVIGSVGWSACEGGGSPDDLLLPLVPQEQDLVATRSPSLLVCPGDEDPEAERMIGPEGGTLEVAGHRIVLPPGAVPTSTTLEIEVPKSDYLEVDFTAGDLSSYTFSVPVQITLSYRRCKDLYPDPTFAAWHIDKPTRKLLEKMGGAIDTSARTVTFWTEHLSVFALAN